MTIAELLNDKWGDVVGLAMLTCGITLRAYDPVAAHLLIGAGLIALRLKTSVASAADIPTIGGKKE